MKCLVLGLCVFALSAKAAPYLVSDPYTPQSDPNLNPVSFVIDGLGANPITVQATTLSNGNVILQYDLATLPHGSYSVTAAAVNIFGGESPFSSPPFTFTDGVPGSPTNIRISPTLLTWVPFGSRIRRTSSQIPFRRPLVPSFS